MRHVLVKVAPGEKSVPSGTVMSATKAALLQPNGEIGGAVTNGVSVGVKGGSGVRVDGGMGGTSALVRTIRGDPQTARSPLADPAERILKMNLTFFPASALRSISAR